MPKKEISEKKSDNGSKKVATKPLKKVNTTYKEKTNTKNTKEKLSNSKSIEKKASPQNSKSSTVKSSLSKKSTVKPKNNTSKTKKNVETKKVGKVPKVTEIRKVGRTAKNTETKQSNRKNAIKPVNKQVIKNEKVIKKQKQLTKQLDEKKNKEETVIEKIKSFIAKIAEMQEEASRELNDKKEKIEKNRKKEETTQNYVLEYYDLPYRYNETIVKILAQTPKRLFVYWDISDNDRKKYIETFGNDYFDKTYPVLLLYNEDKKYIREIAINDFANSWYIDIQDSKNTYTIQLGRKFKNQINDIDIEKVRKANIILRTDYMPFANSNELEAPNDHVLLESLPRFFTFRNVKTNQEFIRDLGSFRDALGNNYDIEGFYNDLYKDEISEGMFDMANPSSNLSSSSFK